MTLSREKIWLLPTIALLIGSLVLFLLGHNKSIKEATSVQVHNPDWSPTALPTAIADNTLWPPPVSQSAGPEWIFDLFTPPVIYFHPQTAKFAVTPPDTDRPAASTFKLRLVALEKTLYRLQYRGHFGREGQYLIQISDEETGAWYRGKPGASFPAAAFRILAFTATQSLQPSSIPGGTPTVETIVHLVLQDERSNQEVHLSTQPKYLDVPTAVLQHADGTTLRLRPGDVVEHQLQKFTLLNIDLPASAASLQASGVDGTIETTLYLQPPPGNSAL